MRRFVLLTLLILPSIGFTHTSKVIVSYSYNNKLQVIALKALVNLEEPWPECDQGLLNVTIDKLAFDGATTRIVGFRARDSAGQYVYFNLGEGLYTSLPPPDLSWVQSLLRKGKKVALTYQRCGAAGRVWFVRDIYAR